MKKILVLSANFPNKENIYNGIFVKEQAIALNKKYSVKVMVVLNDLNNFRLIPKIMTKQYQEDSLDIMEIRISRTVPIINQFVYLFFSTYYCLNFVKKEQIQLIHAHFSYPSAVISYFIKKISKTPFIITEHYGIFENYFRSSIHKYLTLKSIKQADLVISVSKHSKNRIQKYCQKDINVVYNFVNTDNFSLNQKTHTDNIQIGFMGGLNTDIKGLDILLNALKNIEIPFHLHIAGDGTLYKEYLKLTNDLNLNDKVTFYGIIHPNKTKEFFHKLDLFVLSSRRESFGIVIIEALSCGIPVIASKCGGPEEIITPETGYLFNNEDINDLKEKLILFYKNTNNFNHELIRAYTINNFSETTYLNNMTAIINSTTL